MNTISHAGRTQSSDSSQPTDELGFLDIVLPTKGLRCLVTRLPGGRNFQHRFYSTNAELLAAAKAADARGLETYFAVATFKDRSSRRQGNVRAVRSFWADIDCGPGKPYATKRDGATAILGFAKRVGLPLPWLVSSGFGIHAYWPMDRDMAVGEWKPMAQALKRAMADCGVHADPSRTADVASLLRPPGTHNRKAEARLVRCALKGAE